MCHEQQPTTHSSNTKSTVHRLLLSMLGHTLLQQRGVACAIADNYLQSNHTSRYPYGRDSFLSRQLRPNWTCALPCRPQGTDAGGGRGTGLFEHLPRTVSPSTCVSPWSTRSPLVTMPHATPTHHISPQLTAPRSLHPTQRRKEYIPTAPYDSLPSRINSLSGCTPSSVYLL